MATELRYWCSVASPWTWLGHARLAELVRRSGARVQVLPMDLAQVFAATGGRPFSERAPARQSYRQLELARWARRLELPITLQPRHYPVDRGPASQLVIAAREQGLDAMPLLHAVLRAIWVEDRDIADWPTLQAIATAQGLDGAALVAAAQAPRMARQLVLDSERAIAEGVFGAPTVVLGDERFWGQDRLDFLAERLGVCGP